MDIMELGAIGELVGGAAVVASLIYVGLQVRQSNRLEKAESVRASTRDFVTVAFQTDAPLLRRACIDFEGLSKDEQIRAHNHLLALFQLAKTELGLKKQNLAEEGELPQVVASLVRSPGLRYWWDIVAPAAFQEEFRRFIEDSISAQEAQNLPPMHETIPWFSPDPSEAEGV